MNFKISIDGVNSEIELTETFQFIRIGGYANMLSHLEHLLTSKQFEEYVGDIKSLFTVSKRRIKNFIEYYNTSNDAYENNYLLTLTEDNEIIIEEK